MSHTMDGQHTRRLAPPNSFRPDLSRIPAYVEPPRQFVRRDRTPWLALVALLGFLTGVSLFVVYLFYVDNPFAAEPAHPGPEAAWKAPEVEVFLPPPPAISSYAVPMPGGFVAPAATVAPQHAAVAPSRAARR